MKGMRYTLLTLAYISTALVVSPLAAQTTQLDLVNTGQFTTLYAEIPLDSQPSIRAQHIAALNTLFGHADLNTSLADLPRGRNCAMEGGSPHAAQAWLLEQAATVPCC